MPALGPDLFFRRAPPRGARTRMHTSAFCSSCRSTCPEVIRSSCFRRAPPARGQGRSPAPKADLAGQGQTFEIGTPKSQKEFYRKMREQVALNADDYVDKYRAAVDKWIAEARQKKI